MDALRKEGFCTIQVFQQKDLKKIRSEIDKVLLEMPYYQKNTPLRVFGSFQALSDPYSAWHPYIRELREKITASIEPEIKNYTTKYYVNEQVKVATLLDRLLIRPKGITINGEAWHRDIAPPKYLPTDGKIEILGGWTNLDDTPQKFMCVPKSQLDKNGDVLDYRKLTNEGFDKISKDKHDKLNKKAYTVIIPPGHHFLFHQHIIHTIIKNKNKEKLYRLFQGFVISTSKTWSEYPFGGNKELIRLSSEGAIPKTPGGQKWTIYYKNHLFWINRKFTPVPGMNKMTLTEAFKEMFTKEFMEKYKDDNDIVPIVFPSLKEMYDSKVIKNPPFKITQKELEIYIPKII